MVDCARCEKAEQEAAEVVATRWWHCPVCNRHMEHARGSGDQMCSCGAWFNAFGDRLRDDWWANESCRDDEVDDMEGFERAQLRADLRKDSPGWSDRVGSRSPLQG